MTAVLASQTLPNAISDLLDVVRIVALEKLVAKLILEFLQDVEPTIGYNVGLHVVRVGRVPDCLVELDPFNKELSEGQLLLLELWRGRWLPHFPTSKWWLAAEAKLFTLEIGELKLS